MRDKSTGCKNRSKSMNAARIDDRDWSALTRGEQLYQIEVEGYLLMPDLLSPDEVRRLKSETARLKTFPMPYSVHQRDRMLQPGPNPYPGSDWEPYRFGRQGGAITDLIAHEPMVEFLERLFGDEIVFMTYLYARSEPGHPGISLHTDGQPYGSEIFGYECSCPVMVKVLYYLDDLSPDVSPFSVLPRSHLSLHHQANPYQRYRDHPELVMVTAKAGSALVLHPRVFHGNYANVGQRSREMLQVGYRPAWSGPIQEKVPAWDPEDLDLLPPRVRRLFKDRNACKFRDDGDHKPADMASSADWISPGRWDWK